MISSDPDHPLPRIPTTPMLSDRISTRRPPHPFPHTKHVPSATSRRMAAVAPTQHSSACRLFVAKRPGAAPWYPMSAPLRNCVMTVSPASGLIQGQARRTTLPGFDAGVGRLHTPLSVLILAIGTLRRGPVPRARQALWCS